MRILIPGADGYIGTQVTATLLEAGHEVVCCVRDTKRTQAQFPACKIIRCDFKLDTDTSVWQSRLLGIDAVVNCVGIFQSRRAKTIENIHTNSTCALFQACKEANISKLIHISALGAAENAPTLYARTKNAADQYLLNLKLNAVILRPSVVYGVGSHGGSSLFRALAALPWITPVVGDGKQEFQPIHIRDLAKAILHLLTQDMPQARVLNAVGSEKISMHDMLIALRRWLGFGKSFVFKTPVFLMKLGAKVGDVLGVGPMNSTAIEMLLHAYTVEPDEFEQAIGFKPRGYQQGLMTEPVRIQDKWHARLYFVKPLLIFSIAFLWIASGIIPITAAQNASYALLANIGLLDSQASIALYTSATLNIFLGLLTLCYWRLHILGAIQCLVIIAYSTVITVHTPAFWLLPFAPIIKNIPILAATLVMMAMARDR